MASGATVLDSLVIELGFDTKDLDLGKKKLSAFFKEIGEGSGKSGKAVDESSKKQADGIVKLRNELVALLAVFTAGRGIKDFVADMTAGNAALGRFADMLGLSSREVAQWRAGASLLGVNAGDVDASFKGLTTEIQRFSLTGQSSVLPWFRMLGIQFTDLHGNAKDAGQIFLELADRVKSLPRARATTILEQMGISDGMIQVILRGRGAVEQLLASQKEYADALAADAPAAQKRLQAWAELRNELTKLALEVLTKVTPALVGIARAITGFFEAHPDLGKAIIIGLTAAIGALGVAMLALGVASVAGLWPVLLVIGLIGAAVAGVVYASEKWGEIWGSIVGLGSRIGSALGLGPAPSVKGTPAAPAAAPSTPENAIDYVLKHEDPTLSGRVTRDTGGTTKYGISSKANPGLDVANLSLDQARQIYRRKYWSPLAAQPGFSSLPASFQQDALDAAVNQGVGNAVAWLRASGGNQRAFDQLRSAQYQRLATEDPAKYGSYLSGWMSRIPTGGASTSTSTSTASTNIGTLVVNSQAKDAAGISNDIFAELQRRGGVTQQSNSGPT